MKFKDVQKELSEGHLNGFGYSTLGDASGIEVTGAAKVENRLLNLFGYI